MQTASLSATQVGRVSLVGAGPGDPELITVRGVRLLERADVVLYDALAAPALLGHCRAEAELIFVGKRGGRPSTSQGEIIMQMITAARAGRQVVRLKGGDAMLMSRGAEELAAVQAAGVPVEVVPGVTAALAASAAVPLPLTDRNHSHGVILLPGQLAPEFDDGTPAAPPLPWAAYARSGDTLVVYMAMRRLAGIMSRLRAEGRSAHTRVTVVQWASTDRQKVLSSTLDKVAQEAEAAGMAAPSVVIVSGENVG